MSALEEKYTAQKNKKETAIPSDTTLTYFYLFSSCFLFLVAASHTLRRTRGIFFFIFYFYSALISGCLIKSPLLGGCADTTQFCISLAIFVPPLFAGLALQISKRRRVRERARRRETKEPCGLCYSPLGGVVEEDFTLQPHTHTHI